MSTLQFLLAAFAGTAVFFLLQLFLSTKAKNIAVKLIPSVTVLAVAIFCFGLIVGIMSASPNSVSVLTPLALGMSVITGSALIGTVTAWLVYAIIQPNKNKGE